jgi:hypothetical protein
LTVSLKTDFSRNFLRKLDIKNGQKIVLKIDSCCVRTKLAAPGGERGARRSLTGGFPLPPIPALEKEVA